MPWTRIDRWLSDLRLGPLHVETIALSRGEWMARGGLFVRLAPTDDLVAPEIRVEMSAGAEGPFVRITDGVTLYDFPPGAPYEGEEHLAVSNRHWARLFAALGRRAARGPLPLALAIDARAPWSHVLQLVSLAGAAGILGVSVEGSRVSMRFTACPSELTSAPQMEPIARGSPFGHPAWMFVVVGVFTAAVFGSLLTLGARTNATRRR